MIRHRHKDHLETLRRQAHLVLKAMYGQAEALGIRGILQSLRNLPPPETATQLRALVEAVARLQELGRALGIDDRAGRPVGWQQARERAKNAAAALEERIATEQRGGTEVTIRAPRPVKAKKQAENKPRKKCRPRKGTTVEIEPALERLMDET
jgi:hypothetical protein